jgi:hypothetical protein
MNEGALADVVGATLVRTVTAAFVGGIILGWLPGVLLLSVIEFNLSFFPEVRDVHPRVADFAMVAFALTALVVWR